MVLHFGIFVDPLDKDLDMGFLLEPISFDVA
jgi:hypothetical protein